MRELWLVVAVGGLALVSWMYRYEAVAAYGPTSTAYVTDRWTGTTRFCRGARCAPLYNLDGPVPDVLEPWMMEQ